MIMKKKTISDTLVIILSAVLLAGCSGKGGSESGGNPVSDAETPSSEAAPVLSIGKYDADPGETVEVTVSVTGADNKWAMCGVHFSFPSVLECRLSSSDNRFAEFKSGDAVSEMSAVTAAVWTDNRTEEMEKNDLYSLFFAAAGESDIGKDGDIATFYLTVPGDAKPGTVYPLDFFEQEGDMFLDIASDKAVQNYAFSHWQNGSITVK